MGVYVIVTRGCASDFCKEGPGPGRRQAPPLPTGRWGHLVNVVSRGGACLRPGVGWFGSAQKSHAHPPESECLSSMRHSDTLLWEIKSSILSDPEVREA